LPIETMDEPRPERIAAAARVLGAELLERMALQADSIAAALSRELGLVAWDREQLIGQAQAQQRALVERRFRRHGGAPVRVVERRQQPLECLGPVWTHLRQGRRVRLSYEQGSCSAVLELVRTMARRMGNVALSVADRPDSTDDEDEEASDWELVGVAPAQPRVALVEADADPELAAYVLARSCLRRSGADPRGIRRVFVVGNMARLERHLHNIWVGARFGPAEDPGSFAGPLDEATARKFLESQEGLVTEPNLEVLCPGGALERAGDPGHYVAPALCRAGFPGPAPAPAGPVLILVTCSRDEAWQAFDAAGARGAERLQVGGGQLGREHDLAIRRIRGALLTERLPPGLPHPRPV
jgi:hypothetical protein